MGVSDVDDFFTVENILDSVLPKDMAFVLFLTRGFEA
jgi:hypothetical protein